MYMLEQQSVKLSLAQILPTNNNQHARHDLGFVESLPVLNGFAFAGSPRSVWWVVDTHTAPVTMFTFHMNYKCHMCMCVPRKNPRRRMWPRQYQTI